MFQSFKVHAASEDLKPQTLKQCNFQTLPLCHLETCFFSLSRCHGLEIVDYGPSIGLIHTKRHHRKPQWLARNPNAGCQQLNHIGVAGGRRAADSGRRQRPIGVAVRRRPNYRRPLKQTASIKAPIAVSRGVALHAHGHVLDQIFSASGVRSWRGRFFFRLLRLQCSR